MANENSNSNEITQPAESDVVGEVGASAASGAGSETVGKASAVDAVKGAEAIPAEGSESAAGDVAPGTVRVKKRVRTGRRHSSKGGSHGGSAKKMSKPVKVSLIIVVILAVIAIVAAAAIAIFAHQGEDSMKGNGANQQTAQNQQLNTVEYKGETYVYNEDVVSLLVIGYDLGLPSRSNAACADANVLITINTKNNHITAAMVPRDSMVEVDVYKNDKFVATREMQLCLSYAVDLSNPKDCAKNTKRSVERIFYGLPISKYCAIDLTTLGSLASAVGGVQLTALQTVPGTSIYKGKEVMLEGDAAVRYVQWRDTDDDDSALDRQARQKQFVQAFVAKLNKLSPNQMVDLFSQVRKNLVTDLTVQDATYLAKCFAMGGQAKLDFVTLKGKQGLRANSAGEFATYRLKNSSVKAATIAMFYEKAE